MTPISDGNGARERLERIIAFDFPRDILDQIAADVRNGLGPDYDAAEQYLSEAVMENILAHPTEVLAALEEAGKVERFVGMHAPMVNQLWTKSEGWRLSPKGSET